MEKEKVDFDPSISEVGIMGFRGGREEHIFLLWHAGSFTVPYPLAHFILSEVHNGQEPVLCLPHL